MQLAFPTALRRSLNWSLRSLLLLMLLLSLPLGWQANRVRNQRAARAEVERLGGYVLPGPNGDPFEPEPLWLREHFGNDLFDDIVTVSLYGTAATDADVASIVSKLPKLQELNLSRTQISDQSLAAVAKLTKLVELELSECNITDAGLPQLAPLTKLAKLGLWHTHVTPAAVSRLQQLLKSTKICVNGERMKADIWGDEEPCR
jgi:Leucine-rich repeat (LRR) protein